MRSQTCLTWVHCPQNGTFARVPFDQIFLCDKNGTFAKVPFDRTRPRDLKPYLNEGNQRRISHTQLRRACIIDDSPAKLRLRKLEADEISTRPCLDLFQGTSQSTSQANQLSSISTQTTSTFLLLLKPHQTP
jgi:hypothetical protein